nr:nitrous oxide-stimulated promoter family protein [uncultured Desulfuromonas sp.]
MRSSKRSAGDEKLLRKFIAAYCRQNHRHRGASIVCEKQEHGYCRECNELLDYALKRLHHCPLDPKPACMVCPKHCYRTEMRQRIRQVMRFSGLYFIKRGRLGWLWYFFF